MPSIALCDGGPYYIIYMYYVYVLKSENNEAIYTGYTRNLKTRLREHNSGKSTHTNKYKPWKILVYFAFENEKSARNFEKYLKTGSGIAFARKHLL